MDLVDLIDAIVDDCRPYAIEELNTALSDGGGPRNRVRRVHFFSNDDRATAPVAIAEHFGDVGVIATAVAVAMMARRGRPARKPTSEPSVSAGWLWPRPGIARPTRPTSSP